MSIDRQRPCANCGDPFAVHPRERMPRRWCSERCRRWARDHPGVPIPQVRECGSCGADITRKRADARFCSDRCYNIAKGVVRGAPLPSRLCALPECDRLFVPKFDKQRCCSEKHGKWLCSRERRADGREKPEPWTGKRRARDQKRRALKKGATTGEPVVFEVIAERDRWRCHICRKRIGRKIAWPHPRSASLDHLVPLSKGGSHDPVNVRLAHLGCNSSKGNRAVGEQLLLVG